MPDSQGGDSMIELKVTGMSCQHCVKTVTDALTTVPGVTAIEPVTLEGGQVKVRGTASAVVLIAAVRQAGYDAKAVS